MCNKSLHESEFYPYHRKNGQHGLNPRCKTCFNMTVNQKKHASGITHPWYLDKDSEMYFGIGIGETLVANNFPSWKRMPIKNQGYDFLDGPEKIDVKCSKKHQNSRWMFDINQNTIPNRFVCLAFDERKKKIEKAWDIPGNKINHYKNLWISPNTISKYSMFEISLGVKL